VAGHALVVLVVVMIVGSQWLWRMLVCMVFVIEGWLEVWKLREDIVTVVLKLPL
jgi:hypothetical protein